MPLKQIEIYGERHVKLYKPGFFSFETCHYCALSLGQGRPIHCKMCSVLGPGHIEPTMNPSHWSSKDSQQVPSVSIGTVANTVILERAKLSVLERITLRLCTVFTNCELCLDKLTETK